MYILFVQIQISSFEYICFVYGLEYYTTIFWVEERLKKILLLKVSSFTSSIYPFFHLSLILISPYSILILLLLHSSPGICYPNKEHSNFTSPLWTIWYGCFTTTLSPEVKQKKHTSQNNTFPPFVFKFFFAFFFNLKKIIKNKLKNYH